MDRYGALLNIIKRLRLFDAYREGIKQTALPMQLPLEVREAIKAKIFEQFMCLKAGEDSKLLAVMNDAAFEMLIQRLYRDMVGGADHLTPNCTVDELWNSLNQGKQ